MARTITMIPGDGIGPEIAESMMKVVDATNAGLKWEIQDAGLDAFDRTGAIIPDKTHASIRRNKIAIKGPLTTPVGTGHRSANVQLRQKYELFANIRPVKLIPGIRSRYTGEPMDMVLFRENTEGLYAGIEHQVAPGVVQALRIITRRASTAIAKMAFEYARHRKRKKITVVHKANIMKLSDGLFLECAHRVGKKYPEIKLDDFIVDNCCMQIVQNPGQFDVVLLPNLFGDIISDLCAGLVGGLGVTPGANIGRKIAIFESVHGSAPDIAGKGIANPVALILSAAMMLRHLKKDRHAFLIRNAVANVISRGRVTTVDLGGDATTEEFTKELVAEIGRLRRRPSERRLPPIAAGMIVARRAPAAALRRRPQKRRPGRRRPPRSPARHFPDRDQEEDPSYRLGQNRSVFHRRRVRSRYEPGPCVLRRGARR